jgi:hypothetical protein
MLVVEILSKSVLSHYVHLCQECKFVELCVTVLMTFDVDDGHREFLHDSVGFDLLCLHLVEGSILSV